MTGPGLARAFLVGALLAACGRSSQPAPIAFDREPCAHCRMLISDPAFAAQLENADGEVASFDDPGCLLAALSYLPIYHAMRDAAGSAVDTVVSQRSPATGAISLTPQTRVDGGMQPAAQVLPFHGFADLAARPAARRLALLVLVQVVFVTMPGIDLSSTELRQRAAAGKSLRYATPPAVEAYVRDKMVYRGE